MRGWQGSVRAILVCSTERPEWHPVYDALLQSSDVDELVRCRTLNAAVRRLAGSRGSHPELVVVCQWWPDEFTASEVDALLGQTGIARVVCCYGPWCESDGRRGTPWPGALRVPARRAAERVVRELEVLAGRRPALPPTAGREETAAFDLDADRKESAVHLDNAVRCRTSQPTQRILRNLAVAVYSPDAALGDLLVGILQREGLTLAERVSVQVVAPASFGRADVAIWDLDPWCQLTQSRLVEFKRAWPQAIVIGVTGEPSVTDLAREVAWATNIVVPKDGLHDQLPRMLTQAVMQRSALFDDPGV